MEDNYFDKKLKDILNDPPDLQPDLKAISDMKSRLRAENAPVRKSMVWRYAAVAAAMLPFLLFAGFGIQKYNGLKVEMSELRKQIDTYQNVTQRDTIVQQQIVHHYDTIYSIIRGADGMNGYATSNNTPGFEQSFRDQQRFYASLQSYHNKLQELTNTTTPEYNDWGSDGGIYSLLTNRRGTGSFNQVGLGSVFPAAPFNAWEFEAATVASGDLRMLEVPERSTPEWIKELKTKANSRDYKVNPMYFFVPEGFVAEAGFSPAIIPFNNAKGSSKNAYGVAGAITFAGGRSLRIGFEWLTENFEIKDGDIANFPEFPIENPTDPIDVLHELKGNFSTLQIPVTLRQSIGTFGKWRPFFEAGIVATRPLTQDFIYEYINASGEYKLTNSFSDGVFSAENMRLGIGTDFEISDRWSATSYVAYQKDFDQGAGEFEKAEQLQFQVGLSYRLQP